MSDKVREALEHVTELLVDTWATAMPDDPEKELAVIDAREALASLTSPPKGEEEMTEEGLVKLILAVTLPGATQNIDEVLARFRLPDGRQVLGTIWHDQIRSAFDVARAILSRLSRAVTVQDGAEYMAGALRTVVAMAKEKKQTEIYAVAQAGLDLAELGEEGCAQMRGDALPASPSPSKAEAAPKPRPADCGSPMRCGWHHVPTKPEIGLWLCSTFGCPHVTRAASPSPSKAEG